jgi:hypothetical protein
MLVPELHLTRVLWRRKTLHIERIFLMGRQETRSSSIAERLDTVNMTAADRDLAKDQMRFVEDTIESVASGLMRLGKMVRFSAPRPAPVRRVRSA